MTGNQKKEVERLRKLGYGFGTISRQLGVPVDTIKSHCRRHSIQKEPEKVLYVHCLNCGKSLTQIPGRKRKKFCSDACRSTWWAGQPADVRYKTRYKHTCEMCGTIFESHTKIQRFCSQKCAAAMKRGETPAYGPAKESQYAQAEYRANQAWTGEASSDRFIFGADTGRAGFPNLPPYCKCHECAWFVDGEKRCEGGIVPAEKVSPNHSGPELSQEE